ncbi:hypothetical protein IID22_00295 [Patescibacteria group bacterium]|nr:hypothetical protein [Patescibacteria group bacterium]
MYPNFREVVEELQAVPHEKFVHSFLFSRPTPGLDDLVTRIDLPEFCLVPLVEAIGMRLKWCADQTIDRQEGEPLNGNAAIDAERLLATLMLIMRGAHDAGMPVDLENFNLLISAEAEITSVADEARQAWDEAGV